VLEVPKTDLRFNYLLEGLTELGKALILMVTVYYNETTQKAKSRRHQMIASSDLFLVHLCDQHLILPAMMYDNTWK
jgi:hypothetical protein